MRHLRGFRLLALCAALLTGMLGAACSDDGDDAADTSSTTTSEPADDASDPTAEESATTEAEATEPPAAPAEGDQEVAIANYTFEPEAVTVKVGAMVTWTNEDAFAHTATSTGGPSEFDTDDLGNGLSSGIAFDTPGTYEYRCDIHTYMTGTVEVVE